MYKAKIVHRESKHVMVNVDDDGIFRVLFKDIGNLTELEGIEKNQLVEGTPIWVELGNHYISKISSRKN